MDVFVVRIWTATEAEESSYKGDWVRGRIEHVASGRAQAFRELEELGGVIGHLLAPRLCDDESVIAAVDPEIQRGGSKC